MSPQFDTLVQANQLLRAEKRFKEFEASVAQTNDQYQRQVLMTHSSLCLFCFCCHALTLLQLFSLREHLLTVEKQRDAKVAEAAAWAARLQEVQDESNNQMSYQQIEIQVSLRAFSFAPLS